MPTELTIDVTVTMLSHIVQAPVTAGLVEDIRLDDYPKPNGLMRATRFERWAGIGFLDPPTRDETGTYSLVVTGRDLVDFVSQPEDYAIPFAERDEPAEQQPTRVGRIAAKLEDASRSLLDSDSIKHRAAFHFNALDRQTNSAIFEVRAPNFAAIDSAPKYWHEMTTMLMEQLWRRVAQRRHDPNTAMPKLPAPLMHEDLAFVSSRVMGIFDRSDLRTPEEILDAYIMFGAGDLYMPVTMPLGLRKYVCNGGPNSPLLFEFAEFALTAIANDLHADRWKTIFPSLLAAAHAYLLAYGTRDGSKERKPVSMNSGRYGEVPRQAVSESERQFLKNQYSHVPERDFTALLGELLRLGFTDLTGLPPERGHGGSP